MNLDLEQIYQELEAHPGQYQQIAGCYIISSTHPMVNYQSTTNKQYQGHLALGPAKGSGEIVWVGMCTYGPGDCPQRQQTRVYQGMSPQQACVLVNDKAIGKSKRGYEPGYSSHVGMISPAASLDALAETLGELPRHGAPAESALAQLMDQG